MSKKLMKPVNDSSINKKKQQEKNNIPDESLLTSDLIELKKAKEELIEANEELAFQNEEKEKRAEELIIANEELAFQNEEKEKRAAELIVANKELVYQNEEKEKRSEELIIANKELVYQNEEKGKRADELIIANKELAFQNEEKEKRAAELIIANKELAFQNEEKEKRASELIIANKELAFQNEEKEKRAAELMIANKELAIQREKDKRLEEKISASEVNYRRLFESAKDGILMLDAGTGMIVDVNPFLINLLGFSKEQFINKAIWELGFFKDIVINKDKFLELQLKEYVRYEDLPLETAEGEKIHVEFVSNVYLANNQKIIQCNIRDITERFHAQEERKKTMKEIEMISRFPSENPNPILRFNNDCILLFANAPALDFISFCGCEIGQVAPLFVYDLIKEVINKGTNQVIEMQFGDKIWLMTFVPLIADAYVNLYCNDITERKKAEETLVKLRKAVDTSSEAIYLTDKEGIFTYINPGFTALYGYDSDEIVGISTPRILKSGKMEPQFYDELWKTLLSGQEVRLEFINKGKDGKLLDIESSANPIFDEANNIIGFLGIQRDISERKQAEVTLRRSEEDLKESQRIAHVGSWHLDLTSNQVLWTDELYRMYGFDPTLPPPPYTEHQKLFTAESWEKLSNALANTANTGIPYELELETLRKDGSNGWMWVHGKTVIDENGITVGLFGAAQDITERKKAEQELRDNELKFHNYVDHAPHGIFIADEFGNFIDGNPAACKITGYNKEELLSMNFIELIAEESLEIAGGQFKLVSEEGFSSGEVVIIKKDKTKGFWFVDAVKLPNNCLLGFVVDITERKLAEKKIEEIGKHYQALIEKAPDGIVLLNAEGKFKYISPAARKMFGFNESDEIIRDPAEFTHPDDLNLVLSNLVRLFEDPSHVPTLQYRFSDKNGNWKWVETTFSNYLADPSVEAIILNFRDINERKKAEDALQESEKRYRKVTENASDIIFTTDINGNILFGNNASLRASGYSFADFVKMNYLDLTLPEYKRKVQSFYMKQFLNKLPTSYIEYPFKNKSGDIIWLGQSSNLIFENDQIIGFHLLARDITERKLAEEDLRESEERYSTIVDSSPNLIIIHVNYIIRYVNNIGEMLLGYPREEIIGKSILEFFSEESKPIVIDRMQKRSAEEDVPSYEVTIITKSGAEKSALIQATIINYQKEKAFLGMITDITVIKEYERELELSKDKAEEMNRLKSSFLANMSHELRTPMIGILGFSKLLAYSEDAETKETGELIYTSGKRLMDTLNQILDLSRVEAGETKLELSDIDLIEEIAETVNLYQATAKERNLLLSFNTQYEHLYTRTDKKAIDSILNNLINNSVKYTYKGSITVTVAKMKRETEDWAIIEVTDTGIGIEEKNINMIFREFRQVSEGLERSFDGSGLGLTLTKKYIELIGGTITVKSKINEGSIFTVSFPIVPVLFEDDDLPQEEEIIQEEIQKEITHKKNILIVEDDKVTIEFVQKTLKDIYHIDIAMNAMEAIDKAEKKQYDLILMDINLGRSRNGIFTTKEIRKMDNYKDIPIIAMTAYAMEGDKEEFLAGGCSHYISKPFEDEELIALIELALERKKPA